MKTSFKDASIWGVVWRFLLFTLLFALVLVLVIIGLGMASENSIAVFLIALVPALISPFLIYFISYRVTKKRVVKQNFSWDAIKGDRLINWKTIGHIALMTVPVAVAASFFTYVFLLVVTQFVWLQEFLYGYIHQLMLLDSGSMIFVFIIAVVLAPIFEEIFFRGYLLNKWAEKHKQTSAVFWSSFVFMIIHIPSLFIPQLLLGIFVAIVYMKTKKLIYPMFAHAFYNFLVILPSFFTSQPESAEAIEGGVRQMMYPTEAMTQSYIIGTVMFVIFLTITIFVFKKYGKQMKQTTTPYVANVHQAQDYIAYEKNRELTEEEVIEQWEKEQGTNEEIDN